MITIHATTRMQQRGIPPMIDQLLDQYGREEYDGRGAIIKYLDKKSIKIMEKNLGRRIVSRLSEWLMAYKVESLDGTTITIGHRDKKSHINRR